MIDDDEAYLDVDALNPARGQTARRAAYAFLRRLRLAAPLTLYRQGLRESGWRRSNVVGKPVDAAGDPIPWYTYAAVHFLDERLGPKLRVFEYGAGNSTFWYARRVAHVVSVEHDPSWAQYIAQQASKNVEIVLRTDEAEYASQINRYPEPFDVVVIDSLHWRVACAKHVLPRLSPTGVIVWDNSDRADFRTGFRELQLFPGFRELSLYGLVPCGGVMSTTSILYRDGNCLHI